MSIMDNRGKAPAAELVEQFRQAIGNIASTTDERQLRMKSRDFYWYSPEIGRAHV